MFLRIYSPSSPSPSPSSSSPPPPLPPPPHPPPLPPSSSGATVYDEPWPLLCLLLQSLKVSQQLKLFMGWGSQPHAQPHNLEGQGIPFCLDHHL
jgi:hypothetical protein